VIGDDSPKKKLPWRAVIGSVTLTILLSFQPAGAEHTVDATLNALTMRDLMTHTSGLPHYEARDFARGRKNYRRASAGLEQIGDQSLTSPPGTSYLYSTHGSSNARILAIVGVVPAWRRQLPTCAISPRLFFGWQSLLGTAGLRHG
jgi:hypothetical protein